MFWLDFINEKSLLSETLDMIINKEINIDQQDRTLAMNNAKDWLAF